MDSQVATAADPVTPLQLDSPFARADIALDGQRRLL